MHNVKHRQIRHQIKSQNNHCHFSVYKGRRIEKEITRERPSQKTTTFYLHSNFKICF